VLPGNAQDDVYRDNVVIVLDASGSMSYKMSGTNITKMDAAKTALRAVVDQIPPTTRIGILVFSAGNVKNDWIYPLGIRDDAKLIAAINLPIPQAGTPLGRFMKFAANRLLEERQKQLGYGSFRLLVVTDGEASDPEAVNQYTPEIIARGLTVDVIGVDMKQDHTLATMVHSYRRADDPDSLTRAVADVFAEVNTAGGATDTVDEFEILEGLPVEMASAMVASLSTSGNTPIGEQEDFNKPLVASPTTTTTTGTSGQPKEESSSNTVFFLTIIVIWFLFSGKKKGKRGK
jgi:hypothetical protein